VSDDSKQDSAVIQQKLTWGPTVRGVRWGFGDHRVLFLHEPGSDLDAWGSLPRELAQALNVEARAFDLPGHGLSDDPWNPEQLPAVISELSAPEGPITSNSFVIAAGASALATLQIAHQIVLPGLIALSPNGEPQSIPRSPKVPKLFFAGSMAGDDLDHARRLASACGGWAVVTAVPVDAAGTGLLDTDWNRRIAEAIVSFVRDCVSAQTTRLPRKPSPPCPPLPLR
jgi:pimeloyl-ACP methyl ester carboxylesterase